MKKNFNYFVLILLLTAVITNCTRYYMITDTDTGNTYYATNIDIGEEGIVYEDPKTGGKGILTNYTIMEIDGISFRNLAFLPDSNGPRQ